MFFKRLAGKRSLAVAIISGLAVSTLAGLSTQAAAGAATPSGPGAVLQESSSMVSADALPTVQIDGVVWSQVIAGNTVFAGGDFANARPAGAAVGTQQTARTDLLSYNLTTGVLDTSFAPVLNGEVKAVAKSPDGTKLFIGGAFTTVNGVPHNRIAEFDIATGKLVSTFHPYLNSEVQALYVTGSTVYAGGLFTSSGTGSTTRNRLAAFDTTSGALLNWAPSADSNVNALQMTPDGSKMIVGGRFANINGAPACGLAAIDPTTGALSPWAANATVQDCSSGSAILGLSTDGKSIYANGYVYGAGNLEGIISADPDSGTINWLEDCHGDTYGTFPINGTVYVVSHEHFCANDNGWPVYPNWQFARTTAFTANATGTLLHNSQSGYTDWYGKSSPSLYNWFPTLTTGTYTKQYQAAWTVTGNSNYVVEGGEFPSVNGVNQQGLVRFAIKSISPHAQGPQVAYGSWLPKLVSLSPGTVRVSFPANKDRDDLTLNTWVTRNGNNTTPVWKKTIDSTWWNRPSLGFTDTGLTPGATYGYRLFAQDSEGNQISGNTVYITIPTSGSAPSSYDQQVVADGASNYYPLNEPSNTDIYDNAGYNDLVASGTVTRGTAGPVAGERASTFDGSTASAAASTAVSAASNNPAPSTFSTEAWIKTTTTKGGKIIGFANVASGGLSTVYDRHLYMDNTGKVHFGIYNGAGYVIANNTALNDGQWHQVVGTLSSAGMTLYVDGSLVASNASATLGSTNWGYWRIGGDNLSGWNPKVTSNYFSGAIANVAIFPTAISGSTVQSEWVASGRGATAPIAKFTSSAANLAGSFDGSTSSSPNGSISGYSWNFGDGTPAGSGATVSHTYSTAGTYQVTLTVTDAKGKTATTTKSLTVTANVPPVASFTSSTNNLAVSVDGSGSSDPDGTVAGYSWNFGDQSTAVTGKTATHTYATPGTYVITLTVTDNQGATTQVTKSVTMSAGNVSPTASFTSSASNLSVSVDGSGSSDTDGTVTSYSWDFGDHTAPVTGATASHTYASAGTYSITLTVTDNGGATGTSTKSITVTAPVVAAQDAFGRTASNAWGTADVGGAWTVGSATGVYSVGNGTGSIALGAAGNQYNAVLNSLSQINVNALVDVTTDKIATGGGIYLMMGARKNGSSEYRLKVWLSNGGPITLILSKIAASKETTIAQTRVSGLTYTPGMVLRTRFVVNGTGTTNLSGSVWQAGTTEPATAQVTGTDTEATLQATGKFELISALSSTAANAPVVTSWDNLSLIGG